MTMEEESGPGTSALKATGNLMFADKHVVVSRTGSPGWLSIAGEIDYFNVESVGAALRAELQATANGGSESSDATISNRQLHLELSYLEFTDPIGIRALVSLAMDAKPGYELVLHGLPPLIRQVMLLVGWGELPSLTIDDSR